VKREWWKIVLVVVSVLIVTSIVSATNACCEYTENGEWCQYVDEGECDSDYLSAYTSCEQTSYCQVGTCYSSTDGLCFANTAQSTCQNERGYTWTAETKDKVPQCQQGCCVIADQAFYVTEVKCKSVGSGYSDAAISFDTSFGTELECLNSVKNLDEGCCVTEEEAIFQTRAECSVASNDPEVGTNFTEVGFHEDMLCSNDLLSNECAKQHSTNCYEGRVYWFDSCGNRENIYSSDERESHNGGYVLDEEDSCVVDGAEDTECGNCNYAGGNLCGEDKNNKMKVGDVICKDLNCYDTFENDASPLSGYDKQNGESWCVYDSKPGDAADTVGSRHYRHICINGEEIVEPCSDFREEMCISGILNEETFGNMEALNLDQAGSYVEAACRENRQDCEVCNDATAGATANYNCCINEDVRDCLWFEADLPDTVEDSSVYTEDGLSPGICVPQVPKGQVFWSEDGSADTASDGSVCDVASTSCTIEYRLGGVKRLITGKGKRSDKDDWEITAMSPDGCAERDWLVDRNNLCRAQGDCGAHYNFNGQAGVDGFSSSLFDEKFFFEHEEFSVKDLGDWDYYAEVDEWDESSDIPFGVNNPKFYKNPIFYAGIASFLVGGSKGMQACKNEELYKAQLKEATSKHSAEIKCEKNNEGEDLTKCLEKLKNTKTDTPPAGGDTPEVTSRLETVTETTPLDTTATAVAAPSLAPEIDASSLASGASGLQGLGSSFSGLDIGDSAECFVSSAIPILGLLQGGYGALGTDSNTKSLNNLASLEGATQAAGTAQQLAKTAKKAQSAGTASKVANVFTIAAVAYLAVEYGYENKSSFTYDINCGMWQAPSGGSECEVCNNLDTPCSEYKCRSLGAACDLVNAGTSNETCVSLHVNDVNSPIIEPLEAVFSDDFTIETGLYEGNKGFKINEKIPAFTNVQIGLSTDEPSQCKYTTTPSTEFLDMNNYFGDELYLYNHSLMFSLGSEVTDDEVVDALTEGVFTFYVRCSDANGNANEDDYYIQYEVSDTPDLTPPEIVYFSLDSESFMPFQLDKIDFSLYTTEPASCKWNKNDTGYDLMGKDMVCVNSGFEQSSVYFGMYECATTLDGVSDGGINNYYFRCKDQVGNFNEESAKFVTYATENELEIDSVLPEEKSVQDELITLELETSGGAKKGKALCKFSTKDVDYNSMVTFSETNGTDHSQVLTLVEGDHEYFFGCQDLAGNQAYSSTEFKVEIDTKGPVVQYVYVDSIYKVVFIETDENADCEWAPESFNYGEGTSMTGQGTTEHEANLESIYYHVICEDEAGNFNNYVVDLSALV
jgi:hypothetical protein